MICLLVNSLVVSVNNAVVTAVTAAVGIAALCALGVSLLVHLFGNCVECLLHILGSSLDSSNISALVDFLQLINSILDGSLLLCGDLVAQLIQSLFGLGKKIR